MQTQNQHSAQTYQHNLYPDARGRFGPYGGKFVPEILMTALVELENAYRQAHEDTTFQAELQAQLYSFVGRPTTLHYVPRFSHMVAPGVKVYLKREDLAHTGAHKINNALGQGLLVKRMGKRRIVAETGAGQHGVASATVAAGSQTLKDAINEAIRDWVTNVRDTHYLLGSALGPHPYPTMVRDFQSIIGREAREQILVAEKRLPTHLFACVGGGSNSIGLFHQFLPDASVRMVGIEAGGRGGQLGEHAARLAAAQGFLGARPGVLQGTYTYVLQTEDGQIATTHSISAGLDYPAIGPEHAWLADQHRAEYSAVSDQAAL